MKSRWQELFLVQKQRKKVKKWWSKKWPWITFAHANRYRNPRVAVCASSCISHTCVTWYAHGRTLNLTLQFVQSSVVVIQLNTNCSSTCPGGREARVENTEDSGLVLLHLSSCMLYLQLRKIRGLWVDLRLSLGRINLAVIFNLDLNSHETVTPKWLDKCFNINESFASLVFYIHLYLLCKRWQHWSRINSLIKSINHSLTSIRGEEESIERGVSFHIHYCFIVSIHNSEI